MESQPASPSPAALFPCRLPRLRPVLRTHIYLIRKGVVQRDPRLLQRVLRQLTGVRRQLTAPVLRALAKQHAPNALQPLLDAQGSLMVDSSDEEEDLSPPQLPAPSPSPSLAPASTAGASSTSSSSSEPPSYEAQKAAAAEKRRQAEEAENQRREAELLAADVPEVDIYVRLLIAFFLYDRALKDESAALITALFNTLSTHNRRSLDPFSAKIYSFYALVHESLGKDVEIRKSAHRMRQLCCSSMHRIA